MAFSDRIAAAQVFETEVERYCSTWARSVARNGTEHTHPDFVRNLRGLDDAGSKFVRFAPDGVLLCSRRGVIHWEAKYSKCLEKDAYETYLRYVDMGCQVRIFFKHPKTKAVYSQWAECVGFIPSADVVSAFPERSRHPVDAEDWMHPRRGHGTAGSGSGTPYKEIDFESLQIIKHFAEIITRDVAA